MIVTDNGQVTDMLRVTEITPEFSIANSPSRMGFREIVWSGYKTVINNAPDGEEPGVLTSAEGAAEAERCGLAYVHLPLDPLTMLEPQAIDSMAEVLSTHPAPVIAHCRSGIMSAIVWAAVMMRTKPLSEVAGLLARAGLPAEDIRLELERLPPRPAAGT